MAVRGDTIYIVFKLSPIDTKGIYLVRSIDGGETFSDTIRIDPDFGNIPWIPSVEIDALGNPVVSYMESDWNWAEPRYVLVTSNDAGLTFSQPADASRNIAPGEVCDCCPSAVVTSPGRTYVLFRNNQNNLRTIFASVSYDNGASFDTSKTVDLTSTISSTCQSTGPDGFVIGDSLYTFFRANSGGYRAFISSAHADDLVPVVHRKLSATVPTGTIQNYPKADFEDSLSVVIWQEILTGNADIILSYNNSGVPSALGQIRDTVNVIRTGYQINPDVQLSDGNIHTVWQDNSNGSVFYRKGSPSIVTSVGAENEREPVVYPNPFSSVITIKGINGGAKVQLLDATGKVVRENVSAETDLTDLEYGIYFLKMTDSENTRLFKMIKL